MTIEPDADSALVEQALAGEAKDFGPIVKRYWGAVLGVALARLRSFEDAEDVAQQVFIEAFDRLGNLRDAKRLGAWLRSIAIHRSINYLKRSQRVAKLETEHPPVVSREPTPDEVLERDETARNDTEEVLQVRGDVDGEAVHRNPLADVNPDRSHFSPTAPDPRETGPRLGANVVVSQSTDENLFEVANVKMYIPSPWAQVYDRVAHQLPWTMIGCAASPFYLAQLNALAGVGVRIGKQVLGASSPSARISGRMLGQQENIRHRSSSPQLSYRALPPSRLRALATVYSAHQTGRFEGLWAVRGCNQPRSVSFCDRVHQNLLRQIIPVRILAIREYFLALLCRECQRRLTGCAQSFSLSLNPNTTT